MTFVRKYISSIDLGGRLVIIKSDGEVMSEEDLAWFNETVTRQLRNDKVDEALRRKPNYKIPKGQIHPLLNKLGVLIAKHGFNMTVLSEGLRKRRTAVSEWLRGTAKPQLEEAAALFGLVGYSLVPVPNTILAEINTVVQAEERRIELKLLEQSMGGEDDGEIHSGSRSA